MKKRWYALLVPLAIMAGAPFMLLVLDGVFWVFTDHSLTGADYNRRNIESKFYVTIIWAAIWYMVILAIDKLRDKS